MFTGVEEILSLTSIWNVHECTEVHVSILFDNNNLILCFYYMFSIILFLFIIV